MSGVTHTQLQEQLRQGGDRFNAIERQLGVMNQHLSGLPAMQADVAATKSRVDAMGEMFEVYLTVKKTGKAAAWFAGAVKWLGGLVMGAAGIFAAVKAFARGPL